MSEMIEPYYPEQAAGATPFSSINILGTLAELELNPRSYVVTGGASLVLRQIRETTTDIDMLVSDAGYRQLLAVEGAVQHRPPAEASWRGANNMTIALQTNGGIPVSATQTLYGAGYHEMSFSRVKMTANTVKGIPCLSLDELIASKTALRRPKDITDLQLVAKFLGRNLHIPEPSSANPEY